MKDSIYENTNILKISHCEQDDIDRLVWLLRADGFIVHIQGFYLLFRRKI